MLDIDRSISAIRAAAANGCCISYGAVAGASDVVWSARVRSDMPRHLKAVCEKMRGEAGAMISAIVVNEENLETRKLADRAFVGFIACANELKFGPVQDRDAFLREQQDLTFEWGRRTSGK